jgi:RNA polymerase sigma-70 factor (ECF subfamily)
MASDRRLTETAYGDFVAEHERRLRQALTACLGNDAGRDAAAEALAYGWEHWERIRGMANPVGYLFVVGRDRGRRAVRRRRVALPTPDSVGAPWVEPRLPEALAALPQRQRQVVVLLHCFDWTMREAAALLGISKSAVQTHERRGMKRLRRHMGVSA